MKILLTTGGSGGHLFPAIYTARELRRRGHEVVFAGAFGTFAGRLRQEGFPVRDLPAVGFSSKSLTSVLKFLSRMVQSLKEARRILKDVQPDAVAGFGGYGAFPVVWKAAGLGIPTLVHEQNVVPGKANRILFRRVNRIALSFSDTERFVPRSKASVTGCPSNFQDLSSRREEFLRHFQLEPGRVTVIVSGGSQGSRRINKEFLAAAALIKPLLSFQVIHLCGEADRAEVGSASRALGIPYRVFAFSNEMEKIYAVADLAVCRAGAATVTELGLSGLPAVLIPYPYAGGHQKANARVLTDRGLAVMVEEPGMTPERLRDAVLSVREKTVMGERPRRAQDVFSPDAAERIAREIETLPQQSEQKRP